MHTTSTIFKNLNDFLFISGREIIARGYYCKLTRHPVLGLSEVPTCRQSAELSVCAVCCVHR